MPSYEDNQNKPFDLGDPMANHEEEIVNPVDESRTQAKSVSTIQEKSHCLREGEIEFGLPDPKHIKYRDMTTSERNNYEERDFNAEQERLKQLVDHLKKNNSSIKIPKSLRRFCIGILTGVAALILLMLVGQVTSTIAELKLLPLWSQWVIGILLALTVGVLIFLVIKLLFLIKKLSQNEQIDFKGLKSLSEREELKQYVTLGEMSNAKDKLADYLKNYPTNEQDQLFSVGLLRTDIETLQTVQKRLLAEVHTEKTQRWIEKFQVEFQAVLDRSAAKRIKTYSLKVGIKTAISSLPLMDTIIVLTLSLSMVKDLLLLYNLRMKSFDTAQILLKAIAHAYIAGELQGFAVSASNAISEAVINNFGEHINQATADIGKFIGSKAGEGLINAFIVRRIGFATAELLKPTC